MRPNLTHYILAIILLSGCDHIKIKITENACDEWITVSETERSREFRTSGVEYTNTSSSKYIEATIKYTYKNGTVSTSTKKLKPGEIETECLHPKTKVSIVGEREIK